MGKTKDKKKASATAAPQGQPTEVKGVRLGVLKIKASDDPPWDPAQWPQAVRDAHAAVLTALNPGWNWSDGFAPPASKFVLDLHAVGFGPEILGPLYDVDRVRVTVSTPATQPTTPARWFNAPRPAIATLEKHTITGLGSATTSTWTVTRTVRGGLAEDVMTGPVVTPFVCSDGHVH